MPRPDKGVNTLYAMLAGPTDYKPVPTENQPSPRPVCERCQHAPATRTIPRRTAEDHRELGPHFLCDDCFIKVFSPERDTASPRTLTILSQLKDLQNTRHSCRVTLLDGDTFTAVVQGFTGAPLNGQMPTAIFEIADRFRLVKAVDIADVQPLDTP